MIKNGLKTLKGIWSIAHICIVSTMALISSTKLFFLFMNTVHVTIITNVDVDFSESSDISYLTLNIVVCEEASKQGCLISAKIGVQ